MSSGAPKSIAGEDKAIGNIKTGDFILVAGYAALFSIYTAAVLAITDNALARFLQDYQYSGRYIFGLIIFFVAATGFTFFGRWRGWSNWRYFILGALAIFFPLVFLASTIRLFLAGDGSMIQGYADNYCNGIEPVRICGEAFAASVFTMSLRALPTVITAPALYWYLLFYLPEKRKGRKS